MCPMRFILVFFSAILAGYFAWRTVRSPPGAEINFTDDSNNEKLPSTEQQEFNFKRVRLNLFFYFFKFLLANNFVKKIIYFLDFL